MQPSTPFMKPVNIQHPTSNIEHPMGAGGGGTGCWMLDVGCWMFLLSFLAGCRCRPNYHRPGRLGTNAVPPAYTADMPTNASIWKPAQPSAHLPKGPWWEVFSDPELNRLEVQATATTPAACCRLRPACSKPARRWELPAPPSGRRSRRTPEAFRQKDQCEPVFGGGLLQ